MREEERDEKEKIMRLRVMEEGEGKGRRCCLGDRFDSIPYRASHFATGRFEE